MDILYDIPLVVCQAIATKDIIFMSVKLTNVSYNLPVQPRNYLSTSQSNKSDDH